MNTFTVRLTSTGAPTALTVDAITNVDTGIKRVYQRAPGSTIGPVPLSGTYTGGAPAKVQARALLASNDSVIVDWSDVDASPSAGTWSGALIIPQGGPYYMEARASNAHSVSDTGDQFLVGVIGLVHGQSNANGLILQTGGSPPAATANTCYYNFLTEKFEAVPNTIGARRLCNNLASLFGCPVAIFKAAVNGTEIAKFLPGAASAYYEDLFLTQIAVVLDFECVFWIQGEADASVALSTQHASYLSSLTTLHAALAAECDRSTDEMPFFIAGIGEDTAGTQPDAPWSSVQDTLIRVSAELPDVYYSHTNIDAVLIDTVHYDGTSHGRAADRYAQAMGYVHGLSSGLPSWFIASASYVDATHTDVTVAHSVGSDFTPTSGITGFSVSENNGASWVTPSAAIRQNATTIRLTHSSLGATRVLRYMAGADPDTSAPVKDNSSLSSPLAPEAVGISVVNAAAVPLPKFRSSGTVSKLADTSQGETPDLDLGPTASDRVILGVVSGLNARSLSSGTLTPNGGSAVAITPLHSTTGNNHGLSFFLAAMPTGEIADLFLQFSGTRGNVNAVSLFSVNGLSSLTPIDHQGTTAASATNVSTGVQTQDGGFVLAVGTHSSFSATRTIAGELSFAENTVTQAIGGTSIVANAAPSVADASSTVTATFATSAAIAVAAISMR